MHPGLESHPQHELFRRQFSGSCGLFGLQLVEGFSREAVDAMLDGMKLFSMGFSWGGFESLIMQTSINSVRTVEKWKYGDGFGQTLRIHAGLEDVNDLIADLNAGFSRLSGHSE
jgi:cysteine-S-conjugate beta-lyase